MRCRSHPLPLPFYVPNFPLGRGYGVSRQYLQIWQWGSLHCDRQRSNELPAQTSGHFWFCAGKLWNDFRFLVILPCRLSLGTAWLLLNEAALRRNGFKNQQMARISLFWFYHSFGLLLANTYLLAPKVSDPWVSKHDSFVIINKEIVAIANPIPCSGSSWIGSRERGGSPGEPGFDSLLLPVGDMLTGMHYGEYTSFFFSICSFCLYSPTFAQKQSLNS